jgi:anti-sigma regulatory factor (Ser/Thr protein kinase)
MRLKITSDPANLSAVRQSVESLGAENGFSQKACEEIGLCVNEAVANIIRHAYDNATDRPIDLTAEVVDGAMHIEIRDWGNGINPLDLPPRPHDPLKPGGLGLLCLKKMMNHVRFTPQRDGMLLHLTRKK